MNSIFWFLAGFAAGGIVVAGFGPFKDWVIEKIAQLRSPQ